ncbi:hypothetical protein HYV49_02865 [Candidatus Pacearchaeota archaeon]|nr:hypothetical protein [Candidatus Pacearchaeota archaeon]
MVSIKNILLGIAIAIVYAFLVGYGTNLIYNSPEYNDFCKSRFYPDKPFIEPRNCTFNAELNKQARECTEQGGSPVYDYDERGCETSLTCDFCQKDFDEANKKYTRTVFIVSGVMGIIAIAVGALIFNIEAIGAGLMGGGVLSLIYGNIRYWQNLNNWMKVIILAIALVALIYIGILLNRRRQRY